MAGVLKTIIYLFTLSELLHASPGLSLKPQREQAVLSFGSTFGWRPSGVLQNVFSGLSPMQGTCPSTQTRRDQTRSDQTESYLLNVSLFILVTTSTM